MVKNNRQQSMTLNLDVNGDGQATADLIHPIILGSAGRAHMAVMRLKYNQGALWRLGERGRYTLKLMSRDVDDGEREVSYASFVKAGFFHPSVQVTSLYDMWTLLLDNIGFVEHSDLQQPTLMSAFIQIHDDPIRGQISIRQILTRAENTLLYFQLSVNEPMAKALGIEQQTVDIGELDTIPYSASSIHQDKPQELFVYCQELEKHLVNNRMEGLLTSNIVENPINAMASPYEVYEPRLPIYKTLQDLKSIHSLHFSIKDEHDRPIHFQDKKDLDPGRTSKSAIILDLIITIDEHPYNGELWVQYAPR